MDRSSAILHRFLESILLCHYCNTGDSRELVSMKELTGEILTTITDKLAASNDAENLTNHMIFLAAVKDGNKIETLNTVLKPCRRLFYNTNRLCFFTSSCPYKCEGAFCH